MAAVLLLAAGVHADPTPRPADIADYKDTLIVLEDAEGGIYAVSNERTAAHVFYGPGKAKVLYEQILEGSRGRDGSAWSIAIHAPRMAYPFMGTLARRKDGTYFRACGHDLFAELTVVTGDRAKAILDKWKFLTSTMIRRPYLLARDDRGVYYYVDVLRDLYGGNGHRVFVGKKGALKQKALTDVTTDSAGDVFSTKSGDLRLVRTFGEQQEKPTAQWIRGEKKQELIYLDTYMNQPLIYRELGLYRIPYTICGNL